MELTGEARECRATSWADWAQLNTRYLLTSAKSRVRVNLKLYKLVQVPVHSCTQDTGIGDYDTKKKVKKRKKGSFCFTVCLFVQLKQKQTRVSSLVLAVVFLYSRLGEETTKSTSFLGRLPARVVSDAIHTIHAAGTHTHTRTHTSTHGWGVRTNISTLS